MHIQKNINNTNEIVGIYIDNIIYKYSYDNIIVDRCSFVVHDPNSRVDYDLLQYIKAFISITNQSIIKDINEHPLLLNLNNQIKHCLYNFEDIISLINKHNSSNNSRMPLLSITESMISNKKDIVTYMHPLIKSNEDLYIIANSINAIVEEQYFGGGYKNENS